jgi:hypothetical protein
MVLNVGRRAPAAEQMSMIRKYLESGKTVVGNRIASHAFDALDKAPEGHAEWRTFDPDVLDGHYTGHHGNEFKPKVTMAKGAESHSIMAGVRTPFTGQGSLYKTGPLAASARALLLGEIVGHPVEPVAWVNLVGSSRVFYIHIAGPSGRLRQHRVSPLAAQCRLLAHEPPGFFLVGRRVDRGSGLRVCLKRWHPVV